MLYATLLVLTTAYHPFVRETSPPATRYTAQSNLIVKTRTFLRSISTYLPGYTACSFNCAKFPLTAALTLYIPRFLYHPSKVKLYIL